MRRFLKVFVKVAAALLVVATVALAAIGGWFIWHYEYEIGLPRSQELATVSAAGRICSTGGERTFLPLAAIPPMVRGAFLAAEEPDFYDRAPVSFFIEIANAVRFNRPPRISAISTAVARCLMSLSPECCKKRLDWHIGTLVLISRVERTLSKNLIFEVYLNEAWFGRGSYGPVAAAGSYFGKSLSELTVEEAAYLAVLPRAPAIVRDNEHGIRRRNVVIDRMLAAGIISQAEAASAMQRPLLLREIARPF
jgi:membrane carboxypeptidase/penicillin-binding protein